MDIKEKMCFGFDELVKYGPVTIVAFGDSITHGAFLDEIDYESVYWRRLQKKIQDINAYVPVNIINAGIGGTSAASSIGRMDTQVLVHKPDLVIVCFGLNDVNEPLDKYLTALRVIIDKCRSNGSDVIFMTPNMLNTYVAEDTPQKHIKYAAVTAEYQNSGKMDKYMYAAAETAENAGALVCDCYSQWKELSKVRDTTLMLANRINHPIKAMHELFAQALFDMIFNNQIQIKHEEYDLMYNKLNLR